MKNDDILALSAGSGGQRKGADTGGQQRPHHPASGTVALSSLCAFIRLSPSGLPLSETNRAVPHQSSSPQFRRAKSRTSWTASDATKASEALGAMLEELAAKHERGTSANRSSPIAPTALEPVLSASRCTRAMPAFDRVPDSLIHLPRALLALGGILLFVAVVIGLDLAPERTQGATLIPGPLWGPQAPWPAPASL